jgi:hypothetical protein
LDIHGRYENFFLYVTIIHPACLAQTDTVYSILEPGLDYTIIIEDKPGEYVGTTDWFSLGPMCTGRIIRDLQLTPVTSHTPGDTLKTVHIEVDILVSDQETGVPIPGAIVMLVRDDGPVIERTTDANGRISINRETVPGFVDVNHTYTVEVEGVMKHYIGESDAFTTVGITNNTRIIRNLKVRTKVCHVPFPEIVFEQGSSGIDSNLVDSLNLYKEMLLANPTILIELNCFYTNDNQIKLAQKRLDNLLEWLKQNGIPADRVVTGICTRPKNREMVDLYGRVYMTPETRDAVISILSFDYKP